MSHFQYDLATKATLDNWAGNCARVCMLAKHLLEYYFFLGDAGDLLFCISLDDLLILTSQTELE